ncbi:hypothetical protein KPSA3_05286 [Pseudomonas syringae pv. actinidiae]|uniref:Uncharacterized protein n=1 Tax=Pseudomonas syringae pv. actinidiae TaxID=103796 RepID=A0AAN4Q9B2_PSESF|nr:hypothetical protein KPSA3_05286 [Pseudomonas syringae pv. actinidiae]
MQQYFFTRLQTGELKQVQPRRCVHLGNRGSLVQRQAFRHRQNMPSVNHHFLGHRTARQQRANAVTDQPRGARTDFGDHARALQAQRRGDARRRRIHPRTL